MRRFLLWFRAKGCFHNRQTSTHPLTAGLTLCDKCGTVWHQDGAYFGRYRELPLETQR